MARHGYRLARLQRQGQAIVSDPHPEPTRDGIPSGIIAKPSKKVRQTPTWDCLVKKGPAMICGGWRDWTDPSCLTS